MNILIAGYPYIKENYFNTFRYFPGKDKVFFVLPKIWAAKGGKIIFYPPEGPNVFTTKALFYHSHYPIIGGLLKGWMPFFPFILWKFKKKIGASIVYSPSEPVLLTTLYQGLWTKLFGLKHVVFSWENIDYEKKLRGIKGVVQKIILRANLVFSDGIICGNKKGAEIFKRLTQKPIVIIPISGLDEGFFKPSESKIKKEFGDINLDGKIVFSFAGAIGFRKGIHLLVKVFPEVLEQIPNSVLIIAGSGEYEQEIDQLINTLGLGENIIRTPWLNQEQLRHLLSISDVFLYPSLSYGGWEEQFGYSMAEASLMELPIISTTSGSIGEVVINGETGILVKSEDKYELKEAMIRLGKDKNLREKFGTAGRRYIMESFSYQKIAQRFYDFFHMVLER